MNPKTKKMVSVKIIVTRGSGHAGTDEQTRAERSGAYGAAESQPARVVPATTEIEGDLSGLDLF